MTDRGGELDVLYGGTVIFGSYRYRGEGDFAWRHLPFYFPAHAMRYPKRLCLLRGGEGDLRDFCCRFP